MQQATRKVSDLRPHPENVKIYSDAADAEFVAKVEKHGVFDPLLITPGDVIISGHRRYGAAKALGLEDVPVVVSDLVDELDILERLVLCNDQREKTPEQKGREAAALMGVEKERARRREYAGKSQDGKAGGRGRATENPRARAPEGFDAGRARDKVAAKLGIGVRTVGQLVDVVSKIDALDAEGRKDEAGELRRVLNEKSVAAASRMAKAGGRPDASGKPAARPAKPDAAAEATVPAPAADTPFARIVASEDARRLAALLQQAQAASREVAALFRGPLRFHMREAGVVGRVQQLVLSLKKSTPYSACTQCDNGAHGRACLACNGTGWLPEYAVRVFEKSNRKGKSDV